MFPPLPLAGGTRWNQEGDRWERGMRCGGSAGPQRRRRGHGVSVHRSREQLLTAPSAGLELHGDFTYDFNASVGQFINNLSCERLKKSSIEAQNLFFFFLFFLLALQTCTLLPQSEHGRPGRGTTITGLMTPLKSLLHQNLLWLQAPSLSCEGTSKNRPPSTETRICFL